MYVYASIQIWDEIGVTISGVKHYILFDPLKDKIKTDQMRVVHGLLRFRTHFIIIGE